MTAEPFTMMVVVPKILHEDQPACESWLADTCARLLAYHRGRAVTPWVFRWTEITQQQYDIEEAILAPYGDYARPPFEVGDWRVHGACEAERIPGEMERQDDGRGTSAEPGSS